MSHNEFAHVHQDQNLAGSLNYTISLGPFDGGCVWVQCSQDDFPDLPLVPPPDSTADQSLRGKLISTRRQGLAFDGRRLHCSAPWTGDRWVLTAYTSGNWSSLGEPDFRHLQSLDFPLPDIAPLCSTPATLSLSAECGVASQAEVLPGQAQSKEAFFDPGLPGLPSAPLPPSHDAVEGNVFMDLCCGPNRPLSKAFLATGVSVISVDVLRGSDQDLLDDAVFDRVMRVAGSGRVQLAHASPACIGYTRLKMQAPGPKPVRTPEHMQDLPGLSVEEQQRHRASRTLFVRCVATLEAVYAAGGHVVLAHPVNSLAWLEPEATAFMRRIQADLNVIPACKYGMNIYKRWLFVSSYRELRALSGCCQHGPDAHKEVRGKRDASGTRLSKLTAEFPAQLCDAYACTCLPLFSPCAHPCDVQICQLPCLNPIKKANEMPRACQDGGGIHSLPDWSVPHANCPDVMKEVRQPLFALLLQWHAPQRLRQHVQEQRDTPLFDQSEIEQIRALFDSLFCKHGLANISWQPHDGQPYSLLAMQALAHVMQDKDEALWPALMSGVPTGHFQDIPRSDVFMPTSDASSDVDVSGLQVCETNWQGARDNPVELRNLLQTEIENGWLEELTLSEARQRWGEHLAVGKLNVVFQHNGKSRLIMDGSISGTNQSCHINERYNLPSIQDVRASYPLRESTSEISAFSLDVRSAHKSIRIKERDRGLVGIKTEDERYFWYKVCPFGTSFSALWWQRLSSWFVRALHLLLYIAHTLKMFVDDLLATQDATLMPLSGAAILAFAGAFGVPISWSKLQLSHSVLWIGWQINYRAGTVGVPSVKVQRLLEAVQKLLGDTKVARKDLEKATGLLQWITNMCTQLRPWLSFLYADLYRPPATSFSMDPTDWHMMHEYLDEHMRFVRSPPGTGIPVKARLVSARHRSIRCKADLLQVPLTSRRVRMRIQDPGHPQRTISTQSKSFLLFWEKWCMQSHATQLLHMPVRISSVEMAADACAQGSRIGIGGYIRLPNCPPAWFSEKYTLADLACLNLPLNDNAQRDIGCYELLAQIALVLLLATSVPGGRARICVRSMCDNASAEAAINKLMTTRSPMCFFAQQLALVAFSTAITLDCHHVSGFRNESADMLSRLESVQCLSPEWEIGHRMRFPIDKLWQKPWSVNVFPEGTPLLWQPP